MPKAAHNALARVHVSRTTGQMNATEAKYADTILRPLLLAGIITDWAFEGMKLKLAKATFYTPDFFVICADGSVEFHEVKGTWNAAHQDDSRVKIKVAAERHYWARFTSYEFKTQNREWFGPHGPARWAIVGEGK